MADTDFPIATSGNKPVKSFWERPEGTTGMFGIAALGLGAWFALPFLTKLAWSVAGFIGGLVGIAVNVALLIVMGAVIGALLFVLSDKRFRVLTSYLYKSGMRWLTGKFVEIDPIGIMKSYIDSMNEKKAVFDQRKTRLRGQITSLEGIISRNQDEAEKSAAAVRYAESHGNPKEASFKKREFSRYTDQNDRFTKTLEKMRMIYSFMVKYQEACDYVIRDLQSEVKMREIDRKAMAESYGAMNAAKAILRGSGAEKELFDQAMEYAIADFDAKMGEIDSFMEDTESILSGINMQNGMWEESAEKKLLEFEKRSDSIVLGGTKRLMVENNNTGAAVPLNWTTAAPVYVPRNDNGVDVDKFLKS